MAGLAATFESNRAGASGPAGGDVEAALAELFERGRQAWPGVELAPSALAAYLGARAPEAVDPLEFLREVQADGVYLACACARGDGQALRAFDRAFAERLPRYLSSLHPSPDLVAETRQQLLAKLFVPSGGRPPKIEQYGGRGSLEGWVRVAALRTLLNIREGAAGPPVEDDADAVARVIAPEASPELELLKASSRAEFVEAFRGAMGSLSARDRNLLRFAYVDQLTPARIGALHGVHRTTAMRWIEAAEEQVLAKTREALIAKLALSPSECDDLIALVRSRLSFTLGSLLKDAP